MGVILLAALELITVHMIDGREVIVNPKQITSLAEPRASDDPKRGLVHGVNCVINFVDGKFLSVVETCGEVRERLLQTR